MQLSYFSGTDIDMKLAELVEYCQRSSLDLLKDWKRPHVMCSDTDILLAQLKKKRMFLLFLSWFPD